MSGIAVVRGLTGDAANFHFGEPVSVTRLANTDMGVVNVPTGVIGAPSPYFLCNVHNPNAWPQLHKPAPDVVFGSAGAVVAERYAAYDPTTGCVRLYVYAGSSYPGFGLSETWVFDYALIYKAI